MAGFASLVERRAGDRLGDRDRESLHHVVVGGERMAAMLDGVLSYSGVASAGLDVERVDLDAVLDDGRAALAQTIEEHDAVITSDPLPTVAGDRVQLTQLLQNLVANAIRFGDPQAPRIEISARRDGDQWVIEVADNEIGRAHV